MKLLLLIFSFCVFVLVPENTKSQAQLKTVPFTYATNQDEISYNPQIEHKAIKLGPKDFCILGKKAESEFTVNKYDDNLNLAWSLPLNLGLDENLQGFSASEKYIYVLTHKMDKVEGSQKLLAYLFDRKTGLTAGQKVIFEAPSKGRKLGATISDDGSKIFAYQYITTGTREIKSMRGAVIDQNFKILKEQYYDFRELSLSFDPIAKIDNQGNQYLTFITDDYRKLRVRRFTPRTEVFAELSTVLGGVFDGIDTYMFDHIMRLDNSGNPIFAAITVEDSTMRYHSLKVAKFDFTNYSIRMPEEFRFSPEYLAELARFKRDTSSGAAQIVDTYLCDMVFTPQEEVLLIAEKKYTNDEYHGGHEAKEMLLFRYNEFLGSEWQSAIWKEQFANHYQYYSSLGFSTAYFQNQFQIVTFEQIEKRNDVYLRTINSANGAARAPRSLSVINTLDQTTQYLRDFTLWLDKNTIITVTKTKQGTQLNRSRVPDAEKQNPELILRSVEK